MSIDDVIAAEAEASEGDRDASIKPGSAVTRGRPRSKTVQVRLSAEEYDALRKAAQRRGLPVATLARDLLLPHLTGFDDSVSDSIRQARVEGVEAGSTELDW